MGGDQPHQHPATPPPDEPDTPASPDNSDRPDGPPNPSNPPRRPRYRGTHPRTYDERYKEHQPQAYPEQIQKLVAQGRTPVGTHRPIMVEQVLHALRLAPGCVAVDCTLGYGGHAAAILHAIQPNGRLIAIDQDHVELARTTRRLNLLGFAPPALQTHPANFSQLAQVLATAAPEGVDAILADLGVSSMQLDNPARGFSLKHDGPLDMRMNPLAGTSARQLLQTINHNQLSQILRDYADVRDPAILARELLNHQAIRPINTTRELVRAIDDAAPQLGRLSPDDLAHLQRQVFQALRMAVNQEPAHLASLLEQVGTALKPGGRLAILTFHSGEDRLVKHSLRQGLRSGLYAGISEEPVRAGPDEQRSNPRAKSAKLRWAERSR